MRLETGERHTFDRKSMPIVAWYMLSKESYMKRVMREVLPTVATMRLSHQSILETERGNAVPLCSPRKTSLCA